MIINESTLLIMQQSNHLIIIQQSNHLIIQQRKLRTSMMPSWLWTRTTAERWKQKVGTTYYFWVIDWLLIDSLGDFHIYSLFHSLFSWQSWQLSSKSSACLGVSKRSLFRFCLIIFLEIHWNIIFLLCFYMIFVLIWMMI